MGLGELMAAVVILFFLSGCLLFWFGNWFKHRVVVTISVLVSWYFSFIIVVVIPTDVSSTIYRQCLLDSSSSSPINEINSTAFDNLTLLDVDNKTSPVVVNNCTEPWSYVPDNVLQNLWRVVYWTSQVLTWLVFPLMQSFSKAGDFTFFGKFKSALLDNAIYYGSYLFLAVSFLVYLMGSGMSLDWSKLKTIAATASNTWGLTLLILLLGYGLVEVPRTLWMRSKRGHDLNHCYFEASKLAVEKSEAEEEVEDIVRILKSLTVQIPSTHPLYTHLVTIRAKLPESFDPLFSSASGRIQAEGFDQPSEKALVRLHRQLIKALQAVHRTQTQWQVLIDTVSFLEDVAKNEMSLDPHFKPSVRVDRSSLWRKVYSPKIEWYWQCLIKRHVIKLFAFVTAFWTAMVIWSEVTFFVESPTLSLFALFLNLAKSTHDYFSVELVSFFTIVYLCTCTYFTVFKIRILNLYYLAPHHQTDEYSLLFSGMLLCRLTPPLCLNFLSLVHLDSHITRSAKILETSYTHIMGHMDVISFISDYFNIYFPIGVVLLCICTWLSLGARILSVFGFSQFMVEEDVTSDLVQEGKELVRRDKRRRKPAESLPEDQHQRSLPVANPPSASSFGFSRSGSSSRLELIPNAEPISYTSFGDIGPDLSRPPSTNSRPPQRNMFDDI